MPAVSSYLRRQPPIGTRINTRHPLSKGLVAAVALNEGGGTKVLDATPGALRGNFVGTPTWQPGRYAAGVNFGASGSFGSYINFGNVLNLTSAVSCVALVYPTALPNSSSGGGIVVKGISTDGNSAAYELLLLPSSGATKVFARVFTTSANSVQSTATVPLNAWSQVGLTYDSATLKAWLDGASAASGAVSGTMQTNTGNLSIGSRLSGSSLTGSTFSAEFYGSIAYVLIYNRALSAGEFQWLYADPFGMWMSNRRRGFGRRASGLLLARRRKAAA